MEKRSENAIAGVLTAGAMAFALPGLGIVAIPALASGGTFGLVTVGGVSYWFYTGSHSGREGRGVTRDNSATLIGAGKDLMKWGFGNIGREISKGFKWIYKDEYEEEKDVPKGKDDVDKAASEIAKDLLEEAKANLSLEKEAAVAGAEAEEVIQLTEDDFLGTEQFENDIDRSEGDVEQNIVRMDNYLKRSKDNPQEAAPEITELGKRISDDLLRVVGDEKKLLALSGKAFKGSEKVLEHQKRTKDMAKRMIRNAKKHGKFLKKSESKVIKAVGKKIKASRKEKKKMEKQLAKTSGKYAQDAKRRTIKLMEEEISSMYKEYGKLKELEKYLHSVGAALRLSFKRLNKPFDAIGKANTEAHGKAKTFKRSLAKTKLQLKKLDKRSEKLDKAMKGVSNDTPIISFMGVFVAGVIDIQQMLIESYELHNQSYQNDLVPLLDAMQPIAPNCVEVIRVTEYVGDALGKLVQAIEQLDKLAAEVEKGSTVENIAKVQKDLEIDLKTEEEILGTLEKEKGLRGKQYKFYSLIDQHYKQVRGEIGGQLQRLMDRENKIKNQFPEMEQLLNIVDEIGEQNQERHTKILNFEDAALKRSQQAQAAGVSAAREGRRKAS